MEEEEEEEEEEERKEEEEEIISLYNINWLVFITETQCVYCAVRTGLVLDLKAAAKLLSEREKMVLNNGSVRNTSKVVVAYLQVIYRLCLGRETSRMTSA